MSRGDFYENEFVDLNQYNQLINDHNFNLNGSALIPRDIEAVKLEEHVKFLRDNTKLFETIDEETYYRTIESPSCLAEKYTKILVSENPYESLILKKIGISGRDFINFLKISSGSDNNIFFPMPRPDGGNYPLPRKDFLIDRYSIGYTEFLYEVIDEHEFILFKTKDLFI